MKIYVHFLVIFRSVLLKKCLRQKLQRKSKHILCSVTPLPKILTSMNNVEKYFRAEQTTDDNMAHAHRMLDT